MKIIFVMFAVLVSIMTAGTAAYAWDGQNYWYESAVGGPNGPPGPGGGGIVATGGPTDHNITCAHCHIKGAPAYGTLATSVVFSPSVGASYKLGQKYQVTVAITNERLGKSGCIGPDMKNINGFAASFEDEAGKSVGALAAQFGSSANCASSVPAQSPATTFTYGDCHAVIGLAENTTSWTFEWTAPATGTGTPVTMYFGAVDGDCMMNSMDDDVKVGTMKLGAGVATLERPSSSNHALAFFGVLPAVAAVSAVRRRRRRLKSA